MSKSKIIVGSILVGIIACICFSLSYWQFSRLAELKEYNAQISKQMKAPPENFHEIIKNASIQEVKTNQYRPVKVTGVYDEAGEVLISGRSRKDDPGYLVVTPLVLSDTKAREIVYVNRGWISQSLGDMILDTDDKTAIVPAEGYDQERTVVGYVRKNEAKQLYGNDTQVAKNNRVSTRISTEVFTNLSGINKTGTLYPLWIHETHEYIDGKIYKNSNTKYPYSLDDPKLTDRNNLSYALQWIAFSVIAIVVWVLVCKKQMKRPAK